MARLVLSTRLAWLEQGRATYRVQLRGGFTLHHAAGICAQLARFGVTDLYLSPIQRARSGSTHGYDVVDPTTVDDAIGGVEGLRSLHQEARAHGLRLLLDVVPNHMAASAENRWWWDVLRRGRRSRWAEHFDVDWERREGKLVLPRLGAPLEQAIDHLAVVVGEEGLVVEARGEPLAPLRPSSWELLLDLAGPSPGAVAAPGSAARRLAHLESDPSSDEAERRLVARYRQGGELRGRVDRALARLCGGAVAEREGADRLDLWRAVLEPQHWRLDFWREGLERINYRRFFDVADLVALRADREHVFSDTHSLVLDLCADVTLAGLRIDHVDGLLDPEGYLERLDEALRARGAEPYVLVEKILAPDEELRASWRCSGTTGYELANAVTAVLTAPVGFAALCAGWQRFVGADFDPESALRRAKREVLASLFVAEVASLLDDLLSLLGEDAPRLGRDAWRAGLIELTACLDVYRTYLRPAPDREDSGDEDDEGGDEEGGEDGDGENGDTALENAVLDPLDRHRLGRAAQRALASLEAGEAALAKPEREHALQAVAELERLFALEEERASPARRAATARLVLRWQQLTGPAMAKGLEDTLLYRLPVLAALCEVGGDPAGVAPLGDRDAFDRFNLRRVAAHPGSLSATSTHDTKRSEDLRARLLVLAELGEEWVGVVERWSTRHRSHRREVDGCPAPSPAEEWLLYQSLVGIWPARRRLGDVQELKQRLTDYTVKAAREAKENTSWLDPDERWEEALAHFVEAVIADPEQQRELDDLLARVGPLGAWTALAQLVLKLGAPGVCDVYQGCELWSLSLVDPDNRRPVDHAHRARLLAELEARAASDQHGLVEELLADWPSGAIKLWVTWRGLGARRRQAALAAAGDYLPLEVAGARRDHVCAFARRAGDSWAIVVAPRWVAGLCGDGRPPLGEETWGDTVLPLPGGAPGSWRNALSCDPPIAAERGALSVAAALRSLPVALLEPSTDPCLGPIGWDGDPVSERLP